MEELENQEVQTEETLRGTEPDFFAMPLEELGEFVETQSTEEPASQEIKSEPEGEKKEEPEKKVEEKLKAEEQKSVEPEKIELPKDEHEKITRRIQEQDKMIQRQGTEIGLLRKGKQALEYLQSQLPINDEAERARLNQLAFENPIEFHNQMEKRKETVNQIVKQQVINQEMSRIGANRERVLTYVPELETSFGDLIEIIKEDGAKPEDVEVFKRNPYTFAPATLFNLHKRSIISKENKSLKSQIEQLQTENAKLKKRPGELLKNIEDASKVKTLTSKTGGGDQTETDLYSSGNPFELPLDKLREMSGRK